MSRITLITKFKEKELNKINNQLKNINYHMCKVPYGIDDELRNEIDNLPYHFTMNKIKLKNNDIRIMNGRNNSFVLYFSIEENKDIKELQKNSFYKFLERIMIQINLLFI